MSDKTKHPTPAEIEAGQREWQRKFESGEFAAEANAAKYRTEQASPAMLSALRELVSAIDDGDLECTNFRARDSISATVSEARRAIRQADGK